MGNHKSGTERSPFLDVFAISHFRTLWTGQIFSQVATNTLLFVLALRVYQATGSNTAVSGLFLLYAIPAILFGLVAGTVVDKLDKRTVLVVSDISRAIIAVSLLFFSSHVPMMYLLTFFDAVITQFYAPSEAPMIPRFVPQDKLVTAVSLFSFTYFSSLAVGSVFAGPFLKWFGPHGVFFLIAVFFFVASINALRLPQEKGKEAVLVKFWSMTWVYILTRLFINLKDGLTYVKKTPVLREALFLLMGTQILMAILGTLGPGFADRMLNIDIRDASLIITGPAVVGIILGALGVGALGKRVTPLRLIQIGIIAAGIILIVISATVRLRNLPSFAFLSDQTVIGVEFVLFFFFGIANSMLDVPANSILQSEAQGDMRSRVYGMLTAIVGGVGILPVLVGGILADTVGVGKVILVLGILVAGYGVYRLRYNSSKSEIRISKS